jgi:hypothetical protein
VQRRPVEFTVPWITKVKVDTTTIVEKASSPRASRKRRSFHDAEEGRFDTVPRARPQPDKPPCDTRPIVSIRGKGTVMAPSPGSTSQPVSHYPLRDQQQGYTGHYPRQQQQQQQQMPRSPSDYGGYSQYATGKWGQGGYIDQNRATTRYSSQSWGDYDSRSGWVDSRRC